MSLTHDEQHRLNEIEEHLRSSDPALSRRLDPSFEPARDRRGLVRCVLVLLLGTLVMVAGAAGVTGLLSYGTVFVLLGIGLMILALRTARTLNPPPAAGSIR
jgi:Flp pilus assembly protein TadB